MDEGGCGSSGVYLIFPETALENMVLSVSYWGYLQLGLCDVVNYCSNGVYWS